MNEHVAIKKLREGENAGDVMDALMLCKTVEEVHGFMDEYRKTCEHADANVRYMLGYYGRETQRVYYKLLDGKKPDPYDSMTREDLIAMIEEANL